MCDKTSTQKTVILSELHCRNNIIESENDKSLETLWNKLTNSYQNMLRNETTKKSKGGKLIIDHKKRQHPLLHIALQCTWSELGKLRYMLKNSILIIIRYCYHKQCKCKKLMNEMKKHGIKGPFQ